MRLDPGSTDAHPSGRTTIVRMAMAVSASTEIGAALGWPLAAMTVSLKDGKYHDLDSSAEASTIVSRLLEAAGYEPVWKDAFPLVG